MTSRLVAGLAATLVGAAAFLAPAPAVAQRRSPTVASIQVSPPDGQVDVGKTISFFATAFDGGNNTIGSVTDFTWTSTNPRAATVDAYGVATGVAAGVTIIRAQYGRGARSKMGEATLQVTSPGAQPQPQAAAQPTAVEAPAPRGARATGPGCAAEDRQPDGSGLAEGLLVSPLRVSLVKGESQQLLFRAVKGDGTNADKVCIQFNIDAGGERVAQVDSFGVITSVGDTGHAMLRAVVPGRSWQPKQISVEVKGDSVVFSQRELSLAPGAQDTLELVVPAEGDRVLNPAMFQFATSDSTKVRVSPVMPIVSALAPGSARITASSSVYPDIHAVVSVHKPIVGLMGTPAVDSVTLAINASLKLGYRLIASDSSVIEGVPVHWTMPDTTVARFDSTTLTLRGVKAGNTVVTIHALTDRDHERFRHWYIRVVAGGLAVESPQFGLAVGARRPLAVSLLDDARHPLGPATDLRWTSSDTTVARVEGGEAVGVGMGHARLVARSVWDSTVTADVYVVGDLLLAASRARQWNIYMTDRADLTRVRALTNDSSLQSHPAWSPDWRRVAYTEIPFGKSAVSDLYVANADGSGVVRLTNDSATVRCPSVVGPDGNQIVFESNRGGGKAQVYVIGANGSGRRQLTSGEGPNGQPDVSPDGKTVLFVSFRQQNYDVYQVNLDGTNEQRLTTDPRPDDSPVYAADGKSFYYLQLDGGKPATKRVYRQDLTPGAAPVPITPIGMYVQAFSVSADGRTMALTVLEPTADGAGAASVKLFDVATQAATPLVMPGFDAMAWPAFRPPRAAAAAAAGAGAAAQH